MSSHSDEESQPLMVAEPNKKLKLPGLIFSLYFLVCGSAYGAEVAQNLILSEAGYIEWLRQGLGPPFAFFDSIRTLIGIMGELSVFPLIFSSYLNQLAAFETFGEVWATMFCAILLSLLINLAVLLIFALMPFLILFGAQFTAPTFDPSRWFETKMNSQGEPDWFLWLSVLIWAGYGFETSSFLAEQVQNPAKNFPRGLIVTVVIMSLTYLLSMLPALSTMPPNFQLTEGAFPEVAFNMKLGRWMEYVLGAGGLASSFGTFATWHNTAASALHSQAREGELPRFLAADLPYFGTPYAALLVYSATTSIFVLFDFSIVLEVTMAVYSLHVVLLSVNFVYLRIKRPELTRPFKIPGGLPVAVLAAALPAACSIALFALSYWWIWVLGAGLVLVLFGAYFIKQRFLSQGKLTVVG